MENYDNEAIEMTFKNRYNVFSIQQRHSYIESLYDNFKVRGIQNEVLKNSPKYQYSDDRKEGYIKYQGNDDQGHYIIFLPTEKEYDKIKAFTEIEEKRKKLSELANLQRQLVSRNKTFSELNCIEEKITQLYKDIFETGETPKKNSVPEDKPSSHENIFSNKGFILFEHIINNYVKHKRGRLSDIHYFYWKMFNDPNTYIHQRPEPFKVWFNKTYHEDLGKIKTLKEVQNPDRDKHYSNALDWFKNQID